MNEVNNICPRCGADMTQSGAEHNKAYYHCSFCGYNASIEMSADDNAEYWQKRSELLERVNSALLNWKVAGWDYLANDVINFISKYEEARYDVSLKTATIACITKGFHDMDDEKYRECKMIFKVTEKIYKQHIKALADTIKEFPTSEDVTKYQEHRVLYKQLRNDYRNTKFLWKIGFTVGKKLFLWWMPFKTF